MSYDLVPNPPDVQRAVQRLRPVNGELLANQVVRQALHVLLETGRTKATCRAVERFVEPGALNNLTTRLIIVTDITVTLS